jgi:hypothetical protein
MAKSRRIIDTTDVTADMMTAARKNAGLKKARLLAEQEAGIGEEGAGVVKGPSPQTDEEGNVTITLNLAPFQVEIRIDGVIYRNGQTITVREKVAASILEMISHGWKHQTEIEGKAHNFYTSRFASISGKAA